MELITSAKNQYVKLCKSLAEKKFRRETGLFFVEGKNLFKDLPSFVQIEYIFATGEREAEANELSLVHAGAKVLFVTDEIVKQLADTMTPYGIVAVCKMPNVEFKMPSGNALLLDGVADPGNVGTIFRTAAACGFEDVYLVDSADIYSPKVVRATLGGLFKVNAYVIDVDTAKELLKNTNSAVLDMGGSNILKENIECPILFVAGNEAHGVRDEFVSLAKKVYSLPMKNGVESLNVAVATSVAMYRTV